ncbi:MAG: hydrogenase, partial [Clostridia bacterium]|nr:hydrogenase [Clostridia bacterium]
MKIKTAGDLQSIATKITKQRAAYQRRVYVCGGGGCISSDCLKTRDAVLQSVADQGLAGKVSVTFTGCMGLCALGPVLKVEPDGVFYVKVTPLMAEEIIRRHIIGGEIVEEFTYFDSGTQKHIPLMKDIPFYSKQQQIALRNCGRIDFTSLEEYIAAGGFTALAKALTEMTREEVIEVMTQSGLRGRGGGGFPTGVKWRAGFNAPGDKKYLVCNADEGDPGAFMDRSLIEGDPFGLIEGMMIGAYAIGAATGYVYVRAEYPVAIERLSHAIELAREAGLLGANILGSPYTFDLEVRIGAGAFVCGEETALMHSI